MSADRLTILEREVNGLRELVAALEQKLDAIGSGTAAPAAPRSRGAAGLDPADVLHGTAAIASFLGITSRQAKHRSDTRQIPTFKMGRIVCARRSSLQTWMAAQEAAR